MTRAQLLHRELMRLVRMGTPPAEAARWATIAVAVMLAAACGGGDDDRKDPQPPQCDERPEVCK